MIQNPIREIENERDAADAQEPAVERKRQMLIALQGIGGAAILAREVFARTFGNRRELGSYLGLTPSAYDSGSTTRCQGISKDLAPGPKIGVHFIATPNTSVSGPSVCWPALIC